MFCCFKVQPLTAVSAAIFLLLLGSSLPSGDSYMVLVRVRLKHLLLFG